MRQLTGARALRVKNEALARPPLRTLKGTLPTQGIPQKEKNVSLATTLLPEMLLATRPLREDNGVKL